MAMCASENLSFFDEEPDVCAFQQSSPLSLRQHPSSSPSTTPPTPPVTESAQTHDYNFSGAVYDESTSNSESETVSQPDDGYEESNEDAGQRVFSGCSSISSFPTSISQPLHAEPEQYGPRTPSKRDSHGFYSFERSGGSRPATTSPRNLRGCRAAFRHPSSVKALQMKDEAMSETNSVIRHHRRTGSQMSSYSQRSLFSVRTSPTKRSSQSHHTSPLKGSTNLKKEFPLILLHCTLLAPNQPFQPSAEESATLSELLPEEYKQRWLALRDRLKDVEISSRGILIPHPKDDYELLEERLLESLELEKPRIRQNHFFNTGGTSIDSGFESGSLTEDEADLDGQGALKCPDCGGHLSVEEPRRLWDVKVFAANGLMRAGAWAAAWQEMEKVDVEINVRLPEEICRELETKLAFIEDGQTDPSPLGPNDTVADHELPMSREREVYGDVGRVESKVDLTNFQKQSMPESERLLSPPSPCSFEQDAPSPPVGYGRGFSKESRTLLAGVLSVLVLLFALAGKQGALKENPVPTLQFTTQITEVLTTTVTTTSVALSTATVTTSVSRQAPHECSSSDGADDLMVTSTEDLPELPAATEASSPPLGTMQEATDKADAQQSTQLENTEDGDDLASEPGDTDTSALHGLDSTKTDGQIAQADDAGDL
ncbi:flavoprotein oxygenase [Fonsecaea pedrosoi]|nr:flavoprotein oxygenase [Fonsecaea pedrosoi]